MRRYSLWKKGLAVGILLLFTGGLVVVSPCTSGSTLMTVPSSSSSQSEMPYRGIIIGSYWEEWSFFSLREFVEPNVLFFGIVRHDGPMMTHYYRFEVHLFHQRVSSLFVETFTGIQHPHFLFGFCRFYATGSRTTLRQFSGEFHGFALKQPGTGDIYYIIRLNVNGTGLYETQPGLEHRALSGVLHHRHYIELREFSGTKTRFYLSGTGLFNYYYMVSYGPHPFEVSL